MNKCTRCGRTLKKAFFVDGAPYGPVCVRKMFPDRAVVATDGTVRTGRKRQTKVPDSQLSIFTKEDLALLDEADAKVREEREQR